jgi:hypothetical protein
MRQAILFPTHQGNPTKFNLLLTQLDRERDSSGTAEPGRRLRCIAAPTTNLTIYFPRNDLAIQRPVESMRHLRITNLQSPFVPVLTTCGVGMKSASATAFFASPGLRTSARYFCVVASDSCPNSSMSVGSGTPAR